MSKKMTYLFALAVVCVPAFEEASAVVVDDFQEWNQRIQLASIGGLEITSTGHARFAARVDQDATDVIIHPGGVLETLDTYKLPDSHPEPETTNVYVYGTWNARDIESFGVDRAAYIYIGANGQINLERGYDDPAPAYNVLAWLDEAQLGGRSLLLAPELDPAVWSIEIEDLGGGACRITTFGPPPVVAGTPNPENEATDVSRDGMVGWSPGAFAATHDVYLGTVFEDVNDASRADPRGLLVSEGQDAVTFDPGRLEFGHTYYWRVDEVNAAPDSTIFKGQVWSFTVEPFACPIENITATSNATSNTDGGPANTINGSGLDENDHHSTSEADMWLASPVGGDPVQIQYEFDKIYKLHEMLVWNYNVEFEPVLGFGFNSVTVEHSADGVDWTTLGDVEFAQAAAARGYAANTTVDFGGVAAKYVRLTANTNHGAIPQYGLSEVRFLSIPVQARLPQPVDEAIDVSVDAVLSWRAGREAAMHEVLLSTDEAAVANGTALVDTVEAARYTPADLVFGSVYYWKINEVNEAEAISMWESGIWSFTTQEYALIDGFENYDDEDNAIFDTWIDGFVNETGSTVGYFQAPFAERSTVNSGKQSMPLEYNNTGAPFYSEAEFDLGGVDLTAGGAVSLRLFFHGNAANVAETLYVAIEDSAGNVGVAAHSDPDAVLVESWQEWVIPHSELTAGGVNLSRAAMIYIGLGDRNNPTAGGTGTVFIDDIGFGTALSGI